MRSSFILLTVARVIVPIAVLFALYLLLKGHTAPGGGFAAGLVVLGATWLRALAFGVAATKTQLRRFVRPLLAGGLGLAVASVSFSPLVGRPPFTHFHWAIADGVYLSTTLIFDLGVFAVVMGVGASIMTQLSEVVE